jgi:hypothetical protein
MAAINFIWLLLDGQPRPAIEVTSKPAISVTTGSRAELALPNSNPENLHTGKAKTAKPAIAVTTGFGVELSGLESENRAPTASACEPFVRLTNWA